MSGITGENMCQRIPSAQAAAELGVHVAYMHQQMKNGVWDLGEVVAPTKKNGRKNYAYHVYRDKLDKVIRGVGKSSWEIEEFRKQNLKSIKIEALDAGFAIETLEKELESPCADMEAIKAFVRGIGLALKKIEVLAG